VLVATRFPGFAAPGNLASVFNDTSILIMLALGQMTVILTRCIDLSLAANLALTGMIVAMINAAAPGVPVTALILLAVGIGAMLGAMNGLLVWKLDLPAIVVTLGTLTIYRGVIFLISSGAWINAHQMSDAFKALPRTVILGLPVLSWFAVATVLLAWLLVGRTAARAGVLRGGGQSERRGLHRDRRRADAVRGLRDAGAIAGLCGYLWVARYAVAYVDIARGFELDVVAACVIGGISIMGGLGTVAGAVLGALFLGVIKNALPVAGISPFWQLAISGSAIIVAVAFNARAERRKRPGDPEARGACDMSIAETRAGDPRPDAASGARSC
jgi:rhamnose transport system permease protein